MKQLTCEMCGSTDMVKQDGMFACQSCGTKHSVEEAKKMMVEGTVSVEGVVKTENADFEIRAGELIAYHGAETDVVIPDGVKIIGENCFKGMQAIESVTMPDSVYIIKAGAFNGCTGLKRVQLSNGLKEIASAPSANRNGEPYRWYVKDVQGAFSNCTSLSEIELPDSLSVIGSHCFNGCTSLLKISLPKNLITIGAGCFSHCTSLSKIELPDSLSTIDIDCFACCTSLLEVELPKELISIGENCFLRCISLRQIKIPNTVTAIGCSCFYGCASLEKVTIPEGITEIGDGFFCDCSSLQSVYLPNSVTKIGKQAFSNTPKLTELHLPVSFDILFGATLIAGTRDTHTDDDGLEDIIYVEPINSPWIKQKYDELTEERNRPKSGCYIATAVYGSYDCPQVWTLRRYRDDKLAKTRCGRAFIHTYYAVSPTLVNWFGDAKWFRKLWKGKLDRMVENLNAQGVENTPYQDRNW